jgi:fatty-acyl-CoA synthase
MPTRSLSDNEAIEAQSISSRALPESMFEALLASAKRNPHAKALTFFQAASSYNHAHTWTYAEFIADVTRGRMVLTDCFKYGRRSQSSSISFQCRRRRSF